MPPSPRRILRTWILVLGCCVSWLTSPAPLLGSPDDARIFELLGELMSERPRDQRRAADALVRAGDPRAIPPLVDALFFGPRLARPEALRALEALAGERQESYREWVEWIGGRRDIEPPAGYLEWKGELFARIDPRYRSVFYAGAPTRLRLEEVVSGGVPLDGIPTLDHPPHIPAAEATYLQEGETVFGVHLNGEARAYPARILSWHEMVNDTVGGEPVTLSYCTLCGSAILYLRRTPEAGVLTFGTSGLLYRSNKLMFDHETLTLWSNLTGEAVVGRLAEGAAALAMLPMTTTTWGEWRRRHPSTTTLALDRALGRRFGYDYSPGAADRRRTGVSFPIWQRSDRLPDDEEVYALRIGEEAMAYPLATLAAARLVHHEVGGVPLVLVTDPESRAVRAYRRGSLRFRQAPDFEGLIDEQGRSWRITEEALVAVRREGDEPEGPSPQPPEPLLREPGHVAFWFGWFAFYPQTGVWEGR
jgi:hypothetical protein